MMKKLIISVILLFQLHQIYAQNDQLNSGVSCSPQLMPCLQRIRQLPEARQLIHTIQAEGPIYIMTNDESLSEQFGAYWDPDQRAICVNLNKRKSEGEVIGSILFELHNALSSSKVEKLHDLARAGRIDKNSYVEAMERQEYHNSLSAAKLADLGIERGLFPSRARMRTYRNFEEHFQMQKIGGHSAWFAKMYDILRYQHFN
jgi:hypothetical protein